MQRRWAVHAQPHGEVDREELIAALMDGEALLWRAGGVLTVLPRREPTGLPGEMVTTGVVIEWKDRTDAKPQPEQPGTAAAPVPAAPPPAPAPPEQLVRDTATGEEHPVVAVPGSPDGLDESALPEEDVAAVEGAVS